MLPGTLSYARLSIRPWMSRCDPGSASALGGQAGGHGSLEGGPACWFPGPAPVWGGMWVLGSVLISRELTGQHWQERCQSRLSWEAAFVCWFLLVPPEAAQRGQMVHARPSLKLEPAQGLLLAPCTASPMGAPSWLPTNHFLLFILLLWQVDYPLKIIWLVFILYF